MFLLKDKSFTRECKKWEHRITIIEEPYNNYPIDANLKLLLYIKFYGTRSFSEFRIQRCERDCFAKEFVTAENWWNFPTHEIMIQHMKVVGGASIRDTDPSDVNAFSKKPKWDVVDSLEALTPEWKRGIFVGVCMMWQSVKTVQHSEKSVKSVTRKGISRTCVFGSAPKPS